MSRYINPETGGKERSRLTKLIVLAIRELMSQASVTDTSYDLVAFIILALREVYQTIDSSVTAWEKKGYWLKADRYRLEWEWSDSYARNLEQALQKEDWGTIALQSAQIAQKLGDIQISTKHRLGTPWNGAYAILKADK